MRYPADLTRTVFGVFWCVFFSLLAPSLSNAQVFRQITDKWGKSIANTQDIVQDAEGFVWLATERGLYRYDSQGLKRYRNAASDKHSISSNQLRAAFCDSKGNLWIGGTGGLDLYNRAQDNFTHIDHNLPNTNPEKNNQIYFITEGPEGHILVGTPFGLNRIALEGDEVKVTYIIHRVFEGPSQDIVSFGQTSNGDFWLGSLDGLVYIPMRNGEPELFRIQPTLGSPLVNQLYSLFVDKMDVIWLSSNGGGLFRFDTKAKEFEKVKDFRGPDGAWPVITGMHQDESGDFWTSTNLGLAIYNPVKHKVNWLRHDSQNAYSLPDNHITTMYFDKQGGIWLNSSFYGISYFCPDSPTFSPWPFEKDVSKGKAFANAWMGPRHGRGLWLINEKQNQLTLFDGVGHARSQALKLRSVSDYNCFYIDENEVLWAAGNSMLTSCDLKTNVYRDYPTWIAGENYIKKGDPFDILEDSQGRFWIVGTFGILLFDKKEKKFSRYQSVTYSHSIIEDSKQNIWIGGGDEVFLLKKNAKDFVRILTDKSKSSGSFAGVWKMAEGASGSIWAATKQGLQRYDKETDAFVLDERIDLENVEDLRVDKKGYLWLMSNSELTRFHSKSGRRQTYGFMDGLPHSGVSRQASSVEDEKGEFYFMTNEGVFNFSPLGIADEGEMAHIVFTALNLFNKEVAVGDSSGVLSENINEIEHLVLRHDQNIFSVNFALTSFRRSERNHYAYKMQGFDKYWVYTATPSAAYMNLSPGNYVFEVKASDGEGYWTGTPRRLSVEVLPPWWKTGYAYLAYILSTIAFLSLLIRYFWLRDKLRRENELYQVKLDFFTNLSHEVRTHLSLIIGPLEKTFADLSGDTVAQTHLTYARNSSAKLMQLVNELLDFRKIQNKSVVLKVYEYDLVKVLKNILSSFEHLAEDRNITLEFIYSVKVVNLWFDLGQLQKVFYNLLSNAFKFTPNGGAISVELLEVSNEVLVKVMDSGRGIKPQHLSKLFESFFQDHDHQESYGGHGIGLALSKAIVELHHGNIGVTSIEQQGGQQGETCFTIKLLKGKSHFGQEQFGKEETALANTLTFQLANESESTLPPSTEKKNTLLIVEDNDELRAFEEEIFGGMYHVLSASNGQEGLNLAFEYIPDVVLCDIMMPEVNGLDLCGTLKTDTRTSHIPVVLLTARSEVSQVIEGLNASADDYLVKPFDPNVLSLKIANLIKVREELRAYYNKSLALGAGNETLANADGEFIAKLRDLVIENISVQSFGVNEIALHVGMSVSVLYRKLRALTGMTVNDFVKSARMQRAMQLLETGNYQVNEVALSVGYEDVRYFSRQFKKVFGRNPSQICGGKEAKN
ncbi:response regulator [Marinilongibacter aquaticus]|uniref:hybrid sensor histidine kinase/response regulator transcription factor n=1 Tax=Marinilongibacter aquaticus TaxID=2975157 RepID=UPI0021BD24BF|nr:hybrid sensor histidine kinase/response regulator transcription factor [Marinilongibacter aquaticus]UBM60752.1 response regulator [Marinilongibacter aquaticus]